MNILADENIESVMVAWLRDHNHDVIWASESLNSTPDRDLMAIANQDSRILLTRDLDFGELVFREQRISTGIILLRIKAAEQNERLTYFKMWWDQINISALSHFIVVSNKHLRIRPLSL